MPDPEIQELTEREIVEQMDFPRMTEAEEDTYYDTLAEMQPPEWLF